jgi:hypothetical protein
MKSLIKAFMGIFLSVFLVGIVSGQEATHQNGKFLHQWL